MFLNALENQSIPDTETLSLVYMPSQAHWTVQLPMEDTDLEQNHSPVEAICLRQWPSEANNSKQSPLVHAVLKPVKALVCYSSCLLKYIKRLVSFIFYNQRYETLIKRTTIDSINYLIISQLNPLVIISQSSILTKQFPISMNYSEVFYGQKFNTHFA